jgi:hypothetical protein
MVLSHDLVEAAGPQQFSQRSGLSQALRDGVIEQ